MTRGFYPTLTLTDIPVQRVACENQSLIGINVGISVAYNEISTQSGQGSN